MLTNKTNGDDRNGDDPARLSQTDQGRSLKMEPIGDVIDRMVRDARAFKTRKFLADEGVKVVRRGKRK